MRDSEIAQAKTAVRLLSGHMDDGETRPYGDEPEATFSSRLQWSVGRQITDQV